ncbi:hypothetical protein PV325_009521 [Microctonus aethiopoides]|nr:hypothetical protein PV325_009521 [Microctonus aethiopoides]
MAPQCWVSNEAAITENPARKPHQYKSNQWENSTFEFIERDNVKLAYVEVIRKSLENPGIFVLDISARIRRICVSNLKFNWFKACELVILYRSTRGEPPLLKYNRVHPQRDA